MFDSKSILPIPPVNEEILQAVNTNQLVLFVGAGVSTISGLPLWDTLARELMVECKNCGYIDAQELDLIIAKIKDAKKLITIAYETFCKHGKKEDFSNIFSSLLTLPENTPTEEGKIIFDFIRNSNALVLTTNADKLLDSYYEPELVVADLEFTGNEDISRPALVKIHGSVDIPDTLVFTSSQYLERYSNKQFRTFLQTIFKSGNTILFLGYGLGEFELLEYMLIPIDQMDSKKYRKIYVLNPYFTYEEVVKENMDLYYESINIKQIAYSRDENDYKQLANVLKAWKKDVEAISALQSGRFDRIDQCLNTEANNGNCIPIILQVTSQSEQAEQYFFTKLSNNANAHAWVCALVGTPLFDPVKKLHAAKEVTKEDGTILYQSVSWDGLRVMGRLLNLKGADENFLKAVELTLIKTVDEIIRNPEKATNFHVMMTLGNMITSMKENVCGKKLFDYLSILSGSKIEGFCEFLFSASRKESHFLEWDINDIDQIIQMMFNTIHLGKRNHSDYEIKVFTKQSLNTISQKIPATIFEKATNWLNEVEKANPYEFWHIGAIAKYPEDNEPNRNIAIVIEWAKSSVKYADYKILDKFVNDCMGKPIEIKETNNIIRKLAIYAVAVRFDDLHGVLFNLNVNPFSDWNLYSDLYFLMESNNEKFSDEECDTLYKWVTRSNYGMKAEQEEYKSTVKYDFISLIAECHDKYRDLENKYYTPHHDKYPSVYERNKIISSYIKWGPDNDDLINDMAGKSLKKIIQYLKVASFNGRHDLYDHQEALMTTLERNEKLIYEDISLYSDLPIDFYESVIRVISKIDNKSNINRSMEIFKIMLLAVKDDIEYMGVLSEVYQAIENLVMKGEKQTAYLNASYEIVKESLELTSDNFFNEYKRKCSDVMTEILNVWYCEGLEIVLWSSALLEDKRTKEQTIEWLEKLLAQDSDNTVLIKNALVFYLNFLYEIDNSWTNEKLDLIFESYDSILVLAYTNIWSPEVYTVLNNKGFLNKLYDSDSETSSKSIEQIRQQIAGWSMHISIIRNVPPDEVLVRAIKINSTQVLYQLFIEISRFLVEQKSEAITAKDRLIWLCKNVLDNQIEPPKDYDQVIRYLAACISRLDDVDDVIWDCMRHLSKGFNDYISDELYEAFDKHFDKYYKQIIIIVNEMLDNAKAWAFEYEREFDNIIFKIKKDPGLTREFNVINNKFIRRGIFRFSNEESKEE